MSNEHGNQGVPAGGSAVIFGDAFGVTATEGAKQEIQSKQQFREKLAAIKTAVGHGEMIPFEVDGQARVASEQRNVGVAQWQQTWHGPSRNTFEESQG